MSATDDEAKREYEAMIAFEEAVYGLREFGWTRAQVEDRCAEKLDEYDEDAE